MLRIESSNHIVAENDSPADPLTVDLSPAELRPAGVRHAHMQMILLHMLPILRGNDMAKRIRKIVLDQLRHACGAAGKVNQHNVIPPGSFLAGRTLKFIREVVKSVMEPIPAFSRSAHQELILQ